MTADIPTKGITTIYSMIGDSLAWFCVVGLLVMIGSSVSTVKKQ